jgi:signal transduction histidine kinase
MNLVQTLPLATLSITLYVAVFHAYMYVRRLGNRTNLSFAAVCLLEMVIMLILCLASSEEKEVAIPAGFQDFVYVAFQGSPAMEAMKLVVFSTAYAIILPALSLIIRFYRAGNRAACPILIGALLLLLSGINDTLVETRVYSFLYLAEYGGLFLILGMAYAMIDTMAKNQQEMNQARALTAIGRMATEVVHDLTTPLDAIKLAASIAKTDGLDTQEKYLSMIERETRRLSDLSFDILQFVNKERPLAKQAVDLNAYMQEVMLLIRDDFDKHGINLRYTSNYDGPVLIDSDAFKRVILNLAGNA